MNLKDLPEKLERRVSPFRLLRISLKYQEGEEGMTDEQAAIINARLEEFEEDFPFRTDDPQLGLLLGGAAINPSQRRTLMELCTSQEAINLLWAMEAKDAEESPGA